MRMPEGKYFNFQQKNEILCHMKNAQAHFPHLQTACFLLVYHNHRNSATNLSFPMDFLGVVVLACFHTCDTS